MVFIALKPCRFGGTDYLIGDTIPGEKVMDSQVEALRQMGIITIGFEEIGNQLNESVRDAMGDGSKEPHTNSENTGPTEDKAEKQPSESEVTSEKQPSESEDAPKRRGWRKAE